MDIILSVLAGMIVGAVLVVVRLSRLDRWNFGGVRKLLLTSIRQTTHHGNFSFVTPPDWDWTIDE